MAVGAGCQELGAAAVSAAVRSFAGATPHGCGRTGSQAARAPVRAVRRAAAMLPCPSLGTAWPLTCNLLHGCGLLLVTVWLTIVLTRSVASECVGPPLGIDDDRESGGRVSAVGVWHVWTSTDAKCARCQVLVPDPA